MIRYVTLIIAVAVLTGIVVYTVCANHWTDGAATISVNLAAVCRTQPSYAAALGFALGVVALFPFVRRRNRWLVSGIVALLLMAAALAHCVWPV